MAAPGRRLRRGEVVTMLEAAGSLTINPEVVNVATRRSSIERARLRHIVLPTFSQLAGRDAFPEGIIERLGTADPDEARPENLWRVHWYNSSDRKRRITIPDHLVLPEAVTGVKAPIVVLLGSRFPMIGAHKVLPAYAGLVTRLVIGGFDPSRHRAVWPSTGNYCRGGIAISRMLGCDGVAVLPEGMSRERYDWLGRWVNHPSHIVRTVGTESNVKEIYDKCRELEASGENVILNQFSAFSNYMAHYVCTGAACDTVFAQLNGRSGALRLAAFVSATGSAGTIAAGDYLKTRHGSRIAAVEALQCPTMLENGYGEHNIQGIGDKHIPLIHNVMNCDFVIAVSDEVTDQLNLVFNSEVGRNYLLSRADLDPDIIAAFVEVGLSGLANIVAAIKLARSEGYGETDVIVTIATDSARLYHTEMRIACSKFFPDGFSAADAARTFAACLGEVTTDHMLTLGAAERRRIFNLGYFTWVEQQGVSVEDFGRRKEQSFWEGIAASQPAWDDLIRGFNAEVGIN